MAQGLADAMPRARRQIERVCRQLLQHVMDSRKEEEGIRPFLAVWYLRNGDSPAVDLYDLVRVFNKHTQTDRQEAVRKIARCYDGMRNFPYLAAMVTEGFISLGNGPKRDGCLVVIHTLDPQFNRGLFCPRVRQGEFGSAEHLGDFGTVDFDCAKLFLNEFVSYAKAQCEGEA